MAFLLLFGIFNPGTIATQSTDPVSAISELKEGTLIIRFPTYRAKIDTLTSMISRSTDPNNTAWLEKERLTTIQERDTLFKDYTEAFKTTYNFSEVAYFYDYDGKDLNTASYYNLEGGRVASADLSEKPIFYLFFDRSEEKSMDALVVYDRFLRKIPRPFPNDFTLGGLNFLFLKMSGKKFASWRVGKMNKRFHQFYNDHHAQ